MQIEVSQETDALYSLVVSVQSSDISHTIFIAAYLRNTALKVCVITKGRFTI